MFLLNCKSKIKVLNKSSNFFKLSFFFLDFRETRLNGIKDMFDSLFGRSGGSSFESAVTSDERQENVLDMIVLFFSEIKTCSKN